MKNQPCFVFVIVFCFLAGFESHARANNNLFLSGDAFFPTELTSNEISKLVADKDRHEFVYSSFGGYEGAFCGYAGYDRAQIPSLNDKFAANLKLAYERIRQSEPRLLSEEISDGKTVLRETNGIRVLFYNESFKFPNFRLGLRYNEGWVEETVKFGHLPRSIRLCCLLDSKDALMASWRDAGLVDALKVTLPKVEIIPGRKMESPIKINGKLKAIVFGSTSLLEYFEQADGASFLIVDENGISEMMYDGVEEHKWIVDPE